MNIGFCYMEFCTHMERYKLYHWHMKSVNDSLNWLLYHKAHPVHIARILGEI